MKKLSIVIITWNGRQLLAGCLNSLSPLMNQTDTEVIVVDNGSCDGTAEMVRSDFPQVRLRVLSRNYGVSYARNRGLEWATGQYLWLLDNDTVVGQGVADGLMSYLDSHRECGLCACRLIDRSGKVQPSPKRYPGIGEKLANLFHRNGYRYGYSKTLGERVFEPDYLIGACQMFRREVYERIGSLDEHIFYGPEDADFCLRVRNAGWHLAYLPSLSLLHYCQRATWHRLFTPLACRHIQGLLYFYVKHRRFF